MKFLIIATTVLWALTRWTQGFNFLTFAALVTGLMFCGRKIGYFCKMQHLIVIEGIGLFLTWVFQTIGAGVQIKQLIIGVIIRLLFFALVYWESTEWVYTKEIRRKDNEI